jgi:PAS domain S-box-containing protein
MCEEKQCEMLVDRAGHSSPHQPGLEMLEQLVGHLPDILSRFDPQLRCTYTNAAGLKATGLSFEAVLGKTHREMGLPVEFCDHADAALRRVFETGLKASIEFDLPTTDGTRHYEAYAIPELVRDGRIATVITVSRDITERKRVEDALQEREKLYRLIVETANEGIWLTDLEGKVKFANLKAANLLGYTINEMQGLTVFDFFFQEDQDEAQRRFVKRKEGNTSQAEFRARRKDGSELRILLSCSPIQDKCGEVTGLLGMVIDITKQKCAEEERARLATENEAQRKRLSSIVANVPGIVWEAWWAEETLSQSLGFVNDYVETLLGYRTEEWLSKPDFWLSVIYEEDREVARVESEKIILNGESGSLIYRMVAKDGRIIWVETQFAVIKEEGRPLGLRGVTIDITERKQAEAALAQSAEQLRQSQKLESIGQLAGGVAHDFNNMLTAINGYSELTLRRLKEDNPLRHNIEEIKKAGRRSAQLTHQLLAFSRQQILQPQLLSLNQVLGDMSRMLERLIGEDIQLTTILNHKAGQVKVDPGQLSQIIMNLAVNARDAMPQGGKLTFETDNVTLDDEFALHHVSTIPGEYVMMSVSDTGTGMDAETKRHLFEPFFTTKEVGKGTGLGLATVYGIVKQSGGNIWVYSEEGIGTTFKIYFPRVEEEPQCEEKKQSAKNLPIGTETILLVEDEDMVRTLTRQILEECGYTVLEAQSGVDALSLYENYDSDIDLLMTDVVMPRMSGRELAERLGALHPQMHIVFISGYTDDAVVRHGVIEAGTNFIQKPFTSHGLAHKVREVFDKSGRSGPEPKVLNQISKN